MTDEKPPTRLSGDTQRQRRLGDAAKLVPVLALALMLVPVLWAVGSATSNALVYIFVVWAFLIALIGCLSWLLARPLRATPRSGR